MKTSSFLLVVVLGALFLLGCVGPGTSSPSGWGGLLPAGQSVYVGSREGRLLSLNAATGDKMFSFPTQAEKALPGVYATPALDDDKLFLGSFDGKLYALRAKDLTPLWKYPADASRLGRIIGGPVVAGNLVIFGSSDGRVHAIHKDKGVQEWQFATKGMVWATPTVQGDTIYVSSMDHRVYALTLSGAPKWSAPFQAGGAIVSSPLVAEGKVFFGSFDRTFYALDASRGELAWRFSEGKSWFWSNPITDGKSIYAADSAGKLYALDIRSGGKQWEFDLEHPILSTPALVGNRIVIASDGGLVYVLSTGTGRPEAPPFNVGAPVKAPLEGRNGVVYISTMDHRVWALRVVPGQEKLWDVTTRNKG